MDDGWWFTFWFALVAAINLAILAFIVWVVVVLLQHFGVI